MRPSLVPIIIEFMTDRRMTVRYNTASSKCHSLVGGSPQGSWIGQMAYIAASDDAARGLDDEDKYKFCDDLTILELVMMGGSPSRVQLCNPCCFRHWNRSAFSGYFQFENAKQHNRARTVDRNKQNATKSKENYYIQQKQTIF